jgi:toxin ParE1/3/4
VPDAIIFLAAAEADLFDQVRYLAEQSPEVAPRLVIDLRDATEQLLRFPYLGRPWPTRDPALTGLRRLTMSSFPLSIFYRQTADGIEILRVLHHPRDLPPELQGQ